MTGGPRDDQEILGTWLRTRGRQDLAPDPAAIDRIGATVASAFAHRSAATTARPETHASRTGARTGTGLAGRRASRAATDTGWTLRARRARPFTAAAFAAALTVVSIVGPAWAFASESGPGQPLYGARLAAESIGLPAPGTAQRVVAETARLERRVSEVREEASAADWGGATAALGAAREAAHALDQALAAAPGARRGAAPRVREVRRALWVVARDARAPLSVRAAARRTADLLDRPGAPRRYVERP